MNYLDQAWEMWKITHKRKYNAPSEESIRRGIWEMNLMFVNAHNQKYAQGISTAKLGMNDFGDKTINNHLDNEWKNWKITYGKQYNDLSEESLRRAAWEINLMFIEAHNQEYELGNHSFNLGMNQFGDTIMDNVDDALNRWKITNRRNYNDLTGHRMRKRRRAQRRRKKRNHIHKKMLRRPTVTVRSKHQRRSKGPQI